ncbi:MAG TPA: BTAD domain-containing putative transcriptional regulator [Acidimicrobiales bacterium]|nr:BTAD domain-containing putative transcriptional regulator [Acidimicrobiales bacterium]
MSQPSYRLLGSFEAVDASGRRITVPQLQRLLCRLLVSANQRIANDALTGCLWPSTADGDADTAPADPPGALRLYASRLRRVLPQGVGPRSVNGGLAVFVQPDDVDCHRFERLLSEAERTDAADHPDHLSRIRSDLTGALELWRGTALAEFRDEEWAYGVAARLDELRLVARERLSSVRLAMGEHLQLVPELEAFVEEHPLREQLWAQMMLAQYRSGRQADALNTYQRLRARLADDLGIDPNPSLRELERQILMQDPELDLEAPARRAPATSSIGGQDSERRGRMPRSATVFIGRRREAAELEEMVKSARLLSIVGPGGAGKTRLAVEVASRVQGHFADGCFFVDLATQHDVADVRPAVASALGIRLKAGESDALERSLADERLLVVLDNCEHVLEEAALLCESITAMCPGVAVLATTRQPLRVEAERIYRLGPLDLPRDEEADLVSVSESEAVELFVVRARDHDHRFTLTRTNCAAVASLCRQVDGLPLAIEMAAARLPILSPSQISDRLGSELKLVAGGGRQRAPRHQTLDKMIEWSYELLDADERDLLQRLSVFPGSFEIGAVEAISGGVGDRKAVDLLGTLVDKSLVFADAAGDSARYRLLVTVRRFAADQLSSRGPLAEETARAHAWFFLDLVEAFEPRMYSSEQPALLARMDLELDNLRTAVTFFAGDSATSHEAIRILAASRIFLVWRGHEGWMSGMIRAIKARGVAAPVDPLTARFRFMELKYLGHMNPADAIRDLEDLLAVAETLSDRGLESEIVTQIAAYKWFTGQIEEASRYRERALRIAEDSSSYIALVCALTGPGASVGEMLRGVEVAVDAGDSFGRYMALNNLGTEVFERDVDLACDYYEEALAVADSANLANVNPYIYNNLGYAYVLTGEPDRAKAMLARGWECAKRLREDRLALFCLFAFSSAEVLAGNYGLAASLTAIVAKFTERTGFALDPGDQQRLASDETRLRLTLGDRAFAAAREAGRRMDPEEAVRLSTRGPVGEAQTSLVPTG